MMGRLRDWFDRAWNGFIPRFERDHHHEHDIDHEAIARHYFQMLVCAQKPIDPRDMVEVSDPGGPWSSTVSMESLERWHDGYKAWFEACVTPLMKETP